MTPTNRPARLALCFALGAILGTAFDGIHVYGDVLSYPDPAFGRWAWFVPVEFGLLGVGLGLMIPAIERAVAPGWVPAWSIAQRAGEVVLFAGLYWTTTLSDGNGRWPVACAAGLTLLVCVRLLAGRSPGDWIYALGGCVAGPAAEALLIAAGVFDYANPDFANIPIWLVPLWANGGLMMRRLLAPIVLGSAPASEDPDSGGRPVTAAAVDEAPV